MKYIVPDYSFPQDAHQVAENADYSALDAIYAGKTVRYGDFHAHAATGGTSDGKTTLSDWLDQMPGLGLDFIGVMDHRQVRHMYLDEFTTEHFLCGSEPAGFWLDPYLESHYLMLFPRKGMLEQVLEKFPELFEFTGGNEGHFEYIRMSFADFLKIKDAVMEIGGMFVNAHPKQVIKSDDLSVFYFGEGTANEIIYCAKYDDVLNPHTIDNYKVWTALLAEGKKIYNTATADCHHQPKNFGMNCVYTKRGECEDIVNALRAGNLNSGCVAVKMALDDAPMGSMTASGKVLTVKIDDANEIAFDKAKNCRVDIHSDRGIAYSAPLTFPFACAIEVKDRKFYRVEVLDEETGAPMAIGNPIWL